MKMESILEKSKIIKGMDLANFFMKMEINMKVNGKTTKRMGVELCIFMTLSQDMRDISPQDKWMAMEFSIMLMKAEGKDFGKRAIFMEKVLFIWLILKNIKNTMRKESKLEKLKFFTQMVRSLKWIRSKIKKIFDFYHLNFLFWFI